MPDQTSIRPAPPTRDPAIRRRRILLYSAAVLAMLVVAAFAARSLFSGSDKQKPAPKVLTPVILERIQLKPLGGAGGRGLAEVLRRGQAESLRVLAARLKPSSDKQVYQLVLTGGAADEKLLGNEVVGAERIFVGESKVSVSTLHSYSRIELRLITNGAPPSEKTILRGTIPR
jgi:hypothetical protein